jgi:hypothetical protein
MPNSQPIPDTRRGKVPKGSIPRRERNISVDVPVGVKPILIECAATSTPSMKLTDYVRFVLTLVAKQRIVITRTFESQVKRPSCAKPRSPVRS